MRGLTLIELVITVAIIAVIMIAISYLYLQDSRVFGLQNASIAVANGASSIIDTFRDAGLPADAVTSTHTFSGTVYTSGTTTVIFELPAIDSTGAIVTGSFDYIGIVATGTSVYKYADIAAASSRTGGTKLLTSSLSGLSFTYSSTSIPASTDVIANATTTATSTVQVVTTHLREHVYLRNSTFL